MAGVTFVSRLNNTSDESQNVMVAQKSTVLLYHDMTICRLYICPYLLHKFVMLLLRLVALTLQIQHLCR